jgi:hypothetical protein
VLLMKAWMETRWRLLGMVTYLLITLAINYRNHAGPSVLTALWFILTVFAMSLAGAGVKSQAPVGFSEGLAGSTQFTISLPVTRLRLLAVRALFGLAETAVVTVAVGYMTWGLFPTLRETTTLVDFTALVLTTILFLITPYCTHVFFAAWLDEPFSILCAGFTLALLLFLCHHITPGVDIIRAFGQESPLRTHRLPWSQLTASVMLALVLSVAAVRVVQTREY